MSMPSKMGINIRLQEVVTKFKDLIQSNWKVRQSMVANTWVLLFLVSVSTTVPISPIISVSVNIVPVSVSISSPVPVSVPIPTALPLFVTSLSAPALPIVTFSSSVSTFSTILVYPCHWYCYTTIIRLLQVQSVYNFKLTCQTIILTSTSSLICISTSQ